MGQLRLLAYWIVFMVLLVAFVPAFSIIYSPPAMYTQSGTSECQLCPLYFPRIYPWFVWLSEVEEDYLSVVSSFRIELRPPQRGFKYLILVNAGAHHISFATYCTGEEDEEGFPICNELLFRRINSTHSYALLSDRVSAIQIELYIPRELYTGVYIVVAVVPQDAALSEILQCLQVK